MLKRSDWHARLLHGSDYPLPGLGPLYSLAALVYWAICAVLSFGQQRLERYLNRYATV